MGRISFLRPPGGKPPKRDPLLRRWERTVLLPAIAVTAAAALFLSLHLSRHPERPAGTVILVCALMLAVLAVVAVTGVRFLRTVTVPLEKLRALSGQIAAGSYGLRADKEYDDELGDLTDSINTLSEEIARADRVQMEFISSVSHELRTPLTAITGWAEVLEYDEAVTGENRRGVGIISAEAGRLTKMVGELLEFTRLRDGRFTLNIERFDLEALVEDAVFSYGKLLRRDDFLISYDPPETPLPPLEGDPERLQQVLLNILENAAKYGKSGQTAEVSVRLDSDSAIITVRDHGPGIPAEDLPRVKERFFKGSSRARGSGIGLAVCDEIIARHGGTLRVENAPEGGALVTVRLPVHQS